MCWCEEISISSFRPLCCQQNTQDKQMEQTIIHHFNWNEKWSFFNHTSPILALTILRCTQFDNRLIHFILSFLYPNLFILRCDCEPCFKVTAKNIIKHINFGKRESENYKAKWRKSEKKISWNNLNSSHGALKSVIKMFAVQWARKYE